MRTSRTVIAILVIFLLSFGLKTGPAFSADQAFLGAVRELSGVVSPSGTFSAPPVAPIALAPGENFYLVFWAGPLSTNMTFSSAVVTIPPGFVTNGRGSGVSVPPGRTGAIPLTLTSSANASAGATWFAAIGVRAPLVQGSQTATAQSQNTAGSAFTATSPTLTVASPDIAVTLLPPQSTAQTIATLTSASLNVLTPRDGATNVLQPVQFTWQSVPDTVKYRILVSDKSDLSKLYAQWEVQGGATTSYYNPLNDPQTLALSSGTQYYWRVQALDGAGRLLASSSILKFQIQGTATSQTLKHDFAIDKITVPAPLESGAPGKIVVTISNKGTFPESNSSLQLFAKGQPAGTVPVPILNLNETKEITFPYTATSPGTLALSAILSQSADEDMRNNVSNATFTATTPQVNPSLDVNKKAFIKGESVVQKVTGCTPGGMLYGLVINPDGSQAKNGPYGPTDAGGSWSSAWDTGTAWWPNTQFGQYTIRYKDITTGKETNSAAFTVVASFGFNFPEAPATGAYNVKPGATMLAKVSGSTPGGTIQAYSGPTTGPQETALRGTANVVATGTADSSGNAAFTFTPTAPGYWVLWFVDTSTGKKSNIGNFTIFVHELILTPVSLVPDPPSINSQAIWTVRVTNGGGYTETWAPVQFSVDGTVLATQYVKSLAPGASQDVTFPWTPIVVRSYSFETAVVLGDDIEQGNNKDIRSISAAFAGPATQSAALGTEDTGAFGRAFHLYGGTPVLGNSCDRGGGTGSHQWGPGWTQDFCGGSAGDSALMQPADQSNILWVHGTMWQKYRSGGPDKYGYPRSNELPIPASPKGTSGVYQLFQKGIMVWHRNGPKAGQVFWTTYDVGQAWIAKGGAGGPLGFPITEEYSWNGTPTQNYEGGYITWTGQANVTIYKKPGELRVSKGIWIKEPPVEIGKYFDMQYWAKNYGDEPIRVKMLIMALRGPGGENIDPVQDLSARTVGPGEEVQVFVAIPNLGIPRKPGVYTAFASYQDFSGNWHELSAGEPGTLASRGFGVSLPAIAIAQAPAAPPPVTQPTPQSGQPAATGSEDTDAFAKAFQLYGGTPVLGVSKGPSHPWGEGWVQDFAGGSAGDSALMQPKDQGKILWVHGSIWNQYKIGGPTKHGYPRGNEEPAGTSPSGTTGVKQEFANGTLYWMQNGPHTGEVSRLYGGIRDTWAGTASKLGFPLGEEKPWRNGNRQDFEGGYIYWFAGKGNIAYQDIRDRSLYKAALIEKSPIPSLQPGQEATVWVKVRNTGEVAWYKGGQYPIVLGTAAPQDRKSPFTHDSWGGAGKDRPATMREDEVLPGEVATFEFKIKAPTEAKTHN
ncbi:MAG: hypothetical protein HYU64_01270, partial [Armatimonadetes bacterium]|nr:hypothetical protein [Armatimonadota bacterium]